MEKTTKEKMAIMQAFEEGREIEYAHCVGERKYLYCPNPSWDWVGFDYRIKPEGEPKELMTQRQLCELLAKGYGEVMVDDEMETEVYPTYFYSKGNEDKPVADNVWIRPWGGDEWLAPTVDIYQGFVGTEKAESDGDEKADGEKVYKVGEWGQAGWVFYDKGFYSDGWRYMEAAPADLRVVDDIPTVDSTEDGYDSAEWSYIFGFHRTSPNGSNRKVGTNTSIGSGKANTDNLVEAMGGNTYIDPRGSGTTANYAAMLCYVLEYEHCGKVYDDWFLPSRGELNLMHKNLHKKGLGSFADSDYWSSSENNADDAWKQDFSSGYQSSYSRSYNNDVRPARCL